MSFESIIRNLTIEEIIDCRQDMYINEWISIRFVVEFYSYHLFCYSSMPELFQKFWNDFKFLVLASNNPIFLAVLSNYFWLAEVPGVAWENSSLHVWHNGKRWSYGFLQATDLGWCKMRSDLLPFPTFLFWYFNIITVINPFRQRFQSRPTFSISIPEPL